MTEQRRPSWRWPHLIGLGSLIALLVLATACDVGGGTPVPGLLTPTIAVAEKESPYLLDVSLGTPDDGWAAGVLTKGPNGALQPNSDGVLVHYTGGQWNAVRRLPKVALTAVAMVSAEEGWAVGALDTIAHLQDGAWSRYAPPPEAVP